MLIGGGFVLSFGFARGDLYGFRYDFLLQDITVEEIVLRCAFF